MPIYPRPDQIEALLKSNLQGPISMLNLLKFKEKAEYEDGRETDLSGQAAYALYGELMKPFVESKGGHLHHLQRSNLQSPSRGEADTFNPGPFQSILCQRPLQGSLCRGSLVPPVGVFQKGQ